MGRGFESIVDLDGKRIAVLERSILGFTGILLQGLAGPLNEEQQKQLSMVQSSAHHLLALINDVLDISKIEAGELKFSLSSSNLKNRSSMSSG